MYDHSSLCIAQIKLKRLYSKQKTFYLYQTNFHNLLRHDSMYPKNTKKKRPLVLGYFMVD